MSWMNVAELFAAHHGRRRVSSKPMACGKLPRRRTGRSSASVGLLEERVHVGGELVVVLEEEAVGRVRVDHEPRVRK
jgi:hypothetical protein